MLILDLGLREALAGFVLLFLLFGVLPVRLFGVLPVRVFRDRHRMKKAATRAWAAVLLVMAIVLRGELEERERVADELRRP